MATTKKPLARKKYIVEFYNTYITATSRANVKIAIQKASTNRIPLKIKNIEIDYCSNSDF